MSMLKVSLLEIPGDYARSASLKRTAQQCHVDCGDTNESILLKPRLVRSVRNLMMPLIIVGDIQ